MSDYQLSVSTVVTILEAMKKDMAETIRNPSNEKFKEGMRLISENIEYLENNYTLYLQDVDVRFTMDELIKYPDYITVGLSDWISDNAQNMYQVIELTAKYTIEDMEEDNDMGLSFVWEEFGSSNESQEKQEMYEARIPISTEILMATEALRNMIGGLEDSKYKVRLSENLQELQVCEDMLLAQEVKFLELMDRNHHIIKKMLND